MKRKRKSLTVKYSLIQQVDRPTHGVEILDLIYTNDPDLVSSVSAEPWPIFTGHKLVTASVSYRLGSETKPVEKHLLDCGRRLKVLNFGALILYCDTGWFTTLCHIGLMCNEP